MAERRMFAKTIIDSDAFLEMPQSTQLLYFHLSMRADDDGFINNPKSIMRNVGCKEDDIRILAGKKFIIPFESGVVVIKHWKIHNYIQKDRYHETKYKDELSTLDTDENGSYTKCIQNVSKMDTQVRLELGKDSLGKDNEESPDKPAIPSKPKRIKKEFVPPTIEEVTEYVLEKQLVIDPYKFANWYTKTDWKDNQGNQIKNWKNKALNWDTRERDNNPSAVPYSKPKEYAKKEEQHCPKCGARVAFGQCTSCGIIIGIDGKEVVL